MSTGSEAEQRLPVLDFTGFAQEFLRRNREYRAQYAKISEATARDPLSREAREMARTWGLMFPLPTRRTGLYGPCGLGHGNVACNDHP